MNDYVKVAKAADIGAGMMKGYTVNDVKILIANLGGKYYAVEDKCTHMSALLSKGVLLGNIVMCPAHGAQFDVTSGAVLTSPASKPAKAYEVRLNGEDIEIKL